MLFLAGTPVAADPFTLVSQATWGGVDSDIGEAVAVANDGSIYVAGRTRNFPEDATESGINVFVLKFAPHGMLVWQISWDIAGQFADHEVHDLAVGPDGSVYVAGRTFGTGGDALLLKFDSTGNLLWQTTWGGSGFESAEGVAVAADATVYLTGGTQRTFAEDPDAFLVRFAPDGTVLAQKTFGTTGSDGAADVAIASDGNILLLGSTPLPDTFGFYVAKLTPDTSLILWQTSYTAASGFDPRGELAVGSDGSVVVTGAVFGSDFDLNAAVVKFDSAGTLVWDRSWSGRDGDDTGSVAVAADGTVFLVGSTASFGVAPDDAFVVRISPDGRGKDAVTWGGVGLDKGHDVAIALDGNVLVAGTAEAPPYEFLRAPAHTSRLRGRVGVPTGGLTDVVATLADPGGVVADANGSLTYAGGFDATLLTIFP